MIILNNSVDIEYLNIYSYKYRNITFPIFQREYTWKKEQAFALVSEILELASLSKNIRALKQLYLLDLIKFEENGEVKIADGQQRLITFNILLLCINDYIKENGLSLNKLDIFHFKYDDDDLNKKCDLFFKEGKRATSPFANMYKYFLTVLKDNSSIIEDIIDVVENNIFVYMKNAMSADDAFDIFKQINSGGKALTKDDVIKTIVNQYASKYGMTVPSIDFKDVRNLIFTYYKLTMDSSSSNFSNLAVMSFMNEYIVKNKKTFGEFIEFLKIVNSLNKLPIYNVISYINKVQLLSVYYGLGLKGIDLSKRGKYIDKVLLPLCLMCIIWKMKKINPGGIAKSLFTDMLKAINSNQSVDNIESILLDFVTKNQDICKIGIAEFSKGLNSLDFNSKKSLLIMDVIHHNTSGNINVSSVDLEHIYPQTPSNEWLKNGWPGDEESQQLLIDDIGNYMLLCESVNKKIQNKYISEKVIEYNRIIPKDVVLQTPLNTVDFKLFEQKRDLYIKGRHERIALGIMNNFNCGRLLIIDNGGLANG